MKQLCILLKKRVTERSGVITEDPCIFVTSGLVRLLNTAQLTISFTSSTSQRMKKMNQSSCLENVLTLKVQRKKTSVRFY